MDIIQWSVAAGTAIFIALVGFFQWRTAQQKVVLELFERRHSIYVVIRRAVATMTSSSSGFDQGREVEFSEAMERAYFFFGDDVQAYLRRLWDAILDVRTADAELPHSNDDDERRKLIQGRRAAMDRIMDFHSTGQPIFASYMRFAQTVEPSILK